MNLDSSGMWLEGVERLEAGDVGGRLERPEAVVIHYAAGANRAGDLETLTSPGAPRVSAHLHLSRVGMITQMVAFDRVAFHAGASRWEGRENLNLWSLGIELENWGPLTRRTNDELRITNYVSWSGAEVDAGRAMEVVGAYWEKFHCVQVWELVRVLRCLWGQFPLRFVLGHSDVAPGRKLDPGPAFPMAMLRGFVNEWNKRRGDPQKARET